MTSPNPALVSQREAQPLPRAALLLLCAAYVLPGLFGRDPWKNADITAFGYIVNIAQGKTSWLMPTVGGLPADGAVRPPRPAWMAQKRPAAPAPTIKTS